MPPYSKFSGFARAASNYMFIPGVEHLKGTPPPKDDRMNTVVNE